MCNRYECVCVCDIFEDVPRFVFSFNELNGIFKFFKLHAMINIDPSFKVEENYF